jgi:transmembrane sensor
MGNGPEGTDPRQKVGRDLADHRVPDESTPETTDRRSPVDDLIIHALSGTASPFEEERLRRWRETAPENEEHFQEMVQVWILTAPEPVVPASGPPKVEDILAAAPISFEDGWGPMVRKTSRTRRPWLGWGLLAASVAAVGLGIQVVGHGGPVPLAVHDAAQNGSLTVTLADGSFVRLAEGSTLREWEAEGQREVSLDGRAFFAVARDEARPFVVRAGAGEVRVLGTRFQVSVEGHEVETVVVEGLVRVSNGEGSVEVPAGSIARMGGMGAPVAREVNDVFAFMSWPEGILVFQATPLAQVAEEVSRQYGRTIRIDGPDLSQRRVTAWFQGESFEAIAESLCVVTEAVCRTVEGSLTMGMGGSGGGI